MKNAFIVSSLFVLSACSADWTVGLTGGSADGVAADEVNLAPDGATDVTFEPCSAVAGALVQIVGSHFGEAQGAATLSIRGNAVSIVAWSDEVITMRVPSSVTGGSQPVTLVADGTTRALGSFTVLPNVSALSPDAGPVGTLVTLTGSSFGTTQGRSVVTVGGVQAQVESWSMTKIVLRIPLLSNATADVVLRVGGEPTSAVAFQVAAQSPTTVVSFTFDDSYADQLAGAAVLRAHGMRATYYVNAPRIDQVYTPAFMSRAEILALQQDGNEIGGHTLGHIVLPYVDDAEKVRQICDDRANLLAMGFRVTSLAYPFGATDDATRLAVAQCGYNSARITYHTGLPWPQRFPVTDPNGVSTAPSITTATTAAKLEQYVTEVEAAGGGWVPLVLHHVCTTCGPEQTTSFETISTATLDEFAAWLELRAARGTVVRTMQQVVQGALKAPVLSPTLRANPGTGELIANGSLENDSNGDGVIDCFTRGGGGLTSPMWTRTADAHTGSWAMTVSAAAGTTVDRGLALMRDAGSCGIAAVPGQRFTGSAWYKSTAAVGFMLYRRDAAGFWRSWTTTPSTPASASWARATFTTPPVPAGTTGISVTFYLLDYGTMTVDDLSTVLLP